MFLLNNNWKQNLSLNNFFFLHMPLGLSPHPFPIENKNVEILIERLGTFLFILMHKSPWLVCNIVLQVAHI